MQERESAKVLSAQVHQVLDNLRRILIVNIEFSRFAPIGAEKIDQRNRPRTTVARRLTNRQDRMIENEEESGGDQPVLDAIRGQTNIVPVTDMEEARVGMGPETDRTGFVVPNTGSLIFCWNDSSLFTCQENVIEVEGRRFCPIGVQTVSRLLSGQWLRAVRAIRRYCQHLNI